MRIKTSHVYPPIPIRDFDWCTWDDETDEENGPIGYGKTEQEAIDNLFYEIEQVS